MTCKHRTLVEHDKKRFWACSYFDGDLSSWLVRITNPCKCKNCEHKEVKDDIQNRD